MAQIIKVGRVVPIPGSKHLGYTWAGDYCCVVRLDEIKQGQKAILVVPGERVPLNRYEFEWLGDDDYHTVKPVSFFGYRSEALLVPSLWAHMFDAGTDVTRRLGVLPATESHAPSELHPTRAAFCIAFAACVFALAAVAKMGFVDPGITLVLMWIALAVYGLVNLGFSLKGNR